MNLTPFEKEVMDRLLDIYTSKDGTWAAVAQEVVRQEKWARRMNMLHGVDSSIDEGYASHEPLTLAPPEWKP